MKEKRKIFFIIASGLIVLTAFTSCINQQVNEKIRSVSVSGKGSSELKNDQAELSFTFTNKSSDLNRAKTENDSSFSKFSQALIKEGLAQNLISSDDPVIEQSSSFSGGKQYFGPYTVKRSVLVKLKDITKVSKIIETAAKNGEAKFESMKFSASTRGTSEKQARLLALKNSEEKANTLATASGAVLGKVLDMEEVLIEEEGENEAYAISVTLAVKYELLPSSSKKSR